MAAAPLDSYDSLSFSQPSSSNTPVPSVPNATTVIIITKPHNLYIETEDQIHQVHQQDTTKMESFTSQVIISPTSAGTDMSDASSTLFFPRPRQDSTSSTSPSFGHNNDQQRRTSTASSTSPESSPIDPLSRAYPRPEQEINVAEALAREPRKWTLGYWKKHAKDTVHHESQATRLKKFEEAKKELLKAKWELNKLSAMK